MKTFKTIALKLFFIAAAFGTQDLMAQQSGTADKPSGAQPGATDTVRQAPTLKSLDSLMQETKTKDAHPWSNDPDYVRKVDAFKKERDADLKKTEKQRKRQIEQADNRKEEISNSINADQVKLAARCLFNPDEYCAQEQIRLQERRAQANTEYDDRVSAIEYEAEKVKSNINDKYEERIGDLNDKFARDPKYKDQSQLFMSKEKHPDRLRTFSKA